MPLLTEQEDKRTRNSSAVARTCLKIRWELCAVVFFTSCKYMKIIFGEKIAIPLALKKPNYEIDMAKTHFPTIISEYGTFRILFSS